MNVIVPRQTERTRAADGFDRRAFTVAEVRRMQQTGVLGEDERYELIEGEIVPMQAKNYPHERIKLALVRAFSRTLPDTLQLGVETSLYLSERTILEPDLSIFPMMNTEHVRGADVLLAVEIADATLRRDRRLKAPVHARCGVRELWIIDAIRLETHLHREPTDGRWSATETKGLDDILSHYTAPGLAMKLSAI